MMSFPSHVARGIGDERGALDELRPAAPEADAHPLRDHRPIGRSGGRRRRAATSTSRGHATGARHAGRFVNDVDFGATIRAAAGRQSRGYRRDEPVVAIHAQDVHEKQRVAPRSTTILFVVDASWSMTVARRMRAARGAMIALLADAYQRRDRVALITFRKRSATVQLAPTGAIGPARRALSRLPVGGTTPLAAALIEASRVFRRETLRHPDTDMLMIILTDGAANVAVSSGNPLHDAWRAADRLRRGGVRSVVIDGERPERDRGLARVLARRLGASAVVLSDVRADLLYRAVRRAIDLP